MDFLSGYLGFAPSRTYSLFISHAWDYKDEYDGIVKLLNGDISFNWENLSVPFNQPLPMSALLPKSHRSIIRQLDEKINKADCLLVLAGMYAAHRGWIQSEIEAAQEFGKPIIAIVPRGQERLPKVIQAADETVGWASKSIIEAVRRLAASATGSLQTLAGLSATPPPLPRYRPPTLFAPPKTAPLLPPLSPPSYSPLARYRNLFEPPKK
jgi:hypothetical protein